MNKYNLIFSNGPAIVDPQGGVFQPLSGSAILSVEATMVRNGETPYHEELQYLSLLQELVDKHEADPTPREDRTGVGTFSVFGRQMRFSLEHHFPLLTTKKVFFRGMIGELLWMLSGSTNAKSLQDDGIHIWDQWCDENCELGPVYGKQWRSWEGPHDDLGIPTITDQISNVIKSLIEKPKDRGHIVSAWNVADIDKMHLRPCHCLFQFYVEDGKLSCQLYQRSADILLGVPFNIASYAALTHIIARETGLGVGEFVHTFGDLHLYSNHVEQAKEQISRTPRPFPQLEIVGDKPMDDLTFEDFKLEGYDPHPAIKAEVAV